MLVNVRGVCFMYPFWLVDLLGVRVDLVLLVSVVPWLEARGALAFPLTRGVCCSLSDQRLLVSAWVWLEAWDALCVPSWGFGCAGFCRWVGCASCHVRTVSSVLEL